MCIYMLIYNFETATYYGLSALTNMYSTYKYVITFILLFSEDVEINVQDPLNNGLMFIITVNAIIIPLLPSHAEAPETSFSEVYRKEPAHFV